MAINLQPGNASSYPADSGIYNAVGEIVFNNAPAAGEAAAWTCTSAGRPGTFRTTAYVGVNIINTYTAAGAIAVGTRLAKCGAADNFTLGAASSHAAGWLTTTIHNSGGGTATIVAPSGSTLVGTATIADATGLTWMSDGANYWIRCD